MSPGLRSHVHAEGFEHLVIFRKASGLVFAEDQLVVGLHIKNSAGAGNELGVDIHLLLDRIRQTGGFGQVVSLRAIGDADFHEALRSKLQGGPTRRRCLIVGTGSRWGKSNQATKWWGSARIFGHRRRVGSAHRGFDPKGPEIMHFLPPQKWWAEPTLRRFDRATKCRASALGCFVAEKIQFPIERPRLNVPN